jgi:glycosyltransferase involved in cell wall biosynthesis
LYEGFGFPVLEAMACNTPVISSNTSSLPEVAGDAAVLVSPLDHRALADAIRLVLTQPEYANMLRTRGIAQAAKFRWEQCAAETAALYHAVAQAAGADS